MSEQNPEELSLPEQDAGALFRTEMAITNFFLGAWKQLLAVVALGLALTLVYGQYATWHRGQQRQASAEISEVMRKLPERIDPSNMSDDVRKQLEQGAISLEAIGANSSAPVSVEAYLQATEIFRRLDLKESQRRALTAAAPDAEGPLRYAVDGALANLDLEEGSGDAAVERLRAMSKDLDGFLAQQAMIDLGLALEHLERPEEATAVYTDFAKKFPNSTLLDEAKGRYAALNPDAAPLGESAPEAQ